MTAPFVNWSRTVRSQPRRWAHPTCEEDVRALVAEVAAAGGRLKVCGSRHSWSPVAAGDDVQATLHGLDGFVSVDPQAGRVTVEAGVTLRGLCDVLARHGLALPILGSIDQQTVAGAVATGTHGSSLRHGNLSQLVVGARLVTGTGEVLELHEDDPRLDAARVHLGALGVLTRLTLRVVPAYRLEERRMRLPFEEACAHVLPLARAHEFCKLWWLPHTDEALIFTYDRTFAPGERSRLGWTVDGWVNRTVFPALLAVGGAVPPLIPRINRLVDRLHMVESVRRGRSDHLLTLVMPPRHRETELALPAERAGEALRTVRERLLAHGHRLDFIAELRFVAGDRTWMSPAYGRDSCHLGLYGARSRDVDACFHWFHEVGRGWDARPHWGKELTPDAEALARLYPRYDDFVGLTRELDPRGVFRNPFLDRVLGPPRGP